MFSGGGRAAVLLAMAGAACAPTASPDADFYQGRTVRIVVGAAPGGGYDQHARLIARYLPRYLQGRPTIVVTNMPGAGGLVAASHVVSGAPADGLTIGVFMQPPSADAREETPDLRALAMLGSPGPLAPVCLFTRASGIEDVESWRRASPAPRMGATGRGGVTYWVPKMLQAALSLPLDIVSGYTGSPEVRLALESGEIDGACVTAELLLLDGWRDESLVPVLRIGAHTVPAADDLPDALLIATSDRAHDLLRAGIETHSALGRFLAVPRSVPAARVALLREAVHATFSDPDYLREAAAARLYVAPMSAAELDEVVRSLLSTPELLADVTAILHPP